MAVLQPIPAGTRIGHVHLKVQNGIELYWDKPQTEWPRIADGSFAMVMRRLDLNDLINTKH